MTFKMRNHILLSGCFAGACCWEEALRQMFLMQNIRNIRSTKPKRKKWTRPAWKT